MDSDIARGQDGSEELASTISSGTPNGPTEKADRIGAYRILRQIGRGGMGVVYEAEQEVPIKRRVALKLTKWGLDHRSVLDRFETERQALALMSHPNVATMLDAGAAPDGRPYFVMELVQGVPITTYCDEHRLTIAERIQLFAQLCSGLQHAHDRGIIHRDIKPSNVLVTRVDDKPVVKIIDFGVARAIDRHVIRAGATTEWGALVGTPDYMSPEQAGGTGEISPRSDVYSMAVVLYELLVGVRPLDISAANAGNRDPGDRIRYEEPSRPSERLGTLGARRGDLAALRCCRPRALRRVLSDQIDWIVMRALQKRPELRYESADALGRDLRNYLDGNPITARPPSRLWTLRKLVFLRRPAVVYAASTVLFLLGLGGVAQLLVSPQHQPHRTQSVVFMSCLVVLFLAPALGVLARQNWARVLGAAVIVLLAAALATMPLIARSEPPLAPQQTVLMELQAGCLALLALRLMWGRPSRTFFRC